MNSWSRDVEDFDVVCMKGRRQICERLETKLCASCIEDEMSNMEE